MQILFLTPSARSQFSSGRIFSHVTSDAETIYQLSTSGLGLLSSPVRIIGATCWTCAACGPDGICTVDHGACLIKAAAVSPALRPVSIGLLSTFCCRQQHMLSCSQLLPCASVMLIAYRSLKCCAGAMTMLSVQLGWASMVAFVVLLLMMPVQVGKARCAARTLKSFVTRQY